MFSRRDAPLTRTHYSAARGARARERERALSARHSHCITLLRHTYHDFLLPFPSSSLPFSFFFFFFFMKRTEDVLCVRRSKRARRKEGASGERFVARNSMNPQSTRVNGFACAECRCKKVKSKEEAHMKSRWRGTVAATFGARAPASPAFLPFCLQKKASNF